MSSVYIHVPFCRSKCAYCDFFSVIRHDDAEKIAKAIAQEYDMRRGEVPMPVNTVYIGGGTPSVLSAEMLREMLVPIPLGCVEEFTIEVNPDDVTEQKAHMWKELGINRVSMGVQSFVDSELKVVGRRHSAEDARKACRTLRAAGFDNISLDLIYGLPGQTTDSWKYSLDSLVEIHPEHFSAYLLSYEPRTRLASMLKAGKITEATDDEVEQRYQMLCAVAADAGYEHYEISNFALPGRKAVHNSGYWTGVPYLGLGPAAHSFDGALRRFNPPSIGEYLASVGKPEVEPETESDKFNDRVLTALRTAEGLNFPQQPAGLDLRDFNREVKRMLRQGLLVERNGKILIPEERWLVSDSIIRDLFV